jgi:hypothetical protein
MLLRKKDYPGLLRWVKCDQKGLTRERDRVRNHKNRLTGEHFDEKGSSYGQRHAGSL